MRAIVKNIPVDTEIEESEHKDTFCSGEMEEMIGKEYFFVQNESDNWFNSVSDDYEYNGWHFHRSWLEFVE